MAKILRGGSLLFVLLYSVCSFATSLKSSSLRDSVALTYLSQIGVTELTGNNDGPMVEAYQKVTGNKKGDAWCASFVAWSFAQNKLPVHGNAMAASWFRKPFLVWTQRDGERSFDKLAGFRANCGSIYFAKLKRIGHIFFIEDRRGGYVVTVEGNTNNGMSREGVGVFSLKRRIRNIYSISNHFKNG
ncbi:MAG: hypothetical protein LCH37_12985 [Bacteroidetes bacterium]|nr:hypothetical protein [Bacteroidota bacterium]